MTTPSSNVQAALSSLRERWGEVAPRWGGEVLGALAIAPQPDAMPAPQRGSEAVSTGFHALDAILGLGGLPRAATTALHGDGTSGKTTLALRAVAQVQATGGIAAYLDLARSLDPVEAAARGVQLDWLVVLTPDSLAEALAMAAMLLQDRTVDLLLLDLPGGRLDREDPSGSRLGDRLNRLAALARRAGVGVLVLEPPGVSPPLAAALAQIAALRLDLSRRAWIRLGGDVVGQRIEVRVSRDRFGPPGRAAELRILYAEGGLRDACLARDELLRETALPLAGTAPPGVLRPAVHSAVRPSPPLPLPLPLYPVSADATPPYPLAPPSPSPGPNPILHALTEGAGRAGRQAVGGRSGSGREQVCAGAGSPARNAARGGPSAGPGGSVPRS
jgi:RecA/RadA recombinase